MGNSMCNVNKLRISSEDESLDEEIPVITGESNV